MTLSTGCGKKNEQAAPTAPQTNVEASAPATTAPANPANPANQTSQANQTPQVANQPKQPATAQPPGEPDLTVINRALRRWVLANRRPPRSFDDFAASAGVPIPPAPPGKKYYLGSDMHVQLVNQ
jgi:hypothetical protein